MKMEVGGKPVRPMKNPVSWKGQQTASQTAWAILGLVAGREAKGDAGKRG
ncbi:MAG: hypothetical protein CM1200mP16_05450 [Nitrospina sp.]|nr:MAG: hypothetical protein CM1200mP16_05450 [Nitrospina sp.]